MELGRAASTGVTARTEQGRIAQPGAPSILPRRRGPSVQWAEKEGSRAESRAITIALWALALAFTGCILYLQWVRYDRLLNHALDLGNMEQAAWRTAHGDLFQFNNLRIKSNLEGSPTNTRLSFHVEPIFLLLAIPYLIYASPFTLIAIQTVVVASGVFPIAWLARRYLRLPLAQVAFPLAYLLAPPLEAASLYEFHPVTLSAALLMWALYFADGARYRLFAVFAILAISTKEEIGFVVAMIGLWIWWRNRERAIGLTTAILGIGWSLFCVLVIMRLFHNGHSSPYCARFNPYQINGQQNPLSTVTSCTGVAQIWLQHPDQVLSILVMPQKLGFLHRLLMPAGYLSLLSPLTLLISLPSYAIILLSNDIHMYSGLGHYPAEFMPVLLTSAILGTAWLAHRVAPRRRIPPAAVTALACLWLIAASVANQRVNGFTPLYEGFSLPPRTAHAQLGHRIAAMIPPDAAVSAGDFMNPLLSNRKNIYLFPDVGDAQYAVVDVSRDNFPLSPGQEMSWVKSLLAGGQWGVVYASDGYALLEKRRFNPALPTRLPPPFYSFALPASPPTIGHPMLVRFGPSVELLGYDLERAEQVNLRQADIILTTYWQVTAPLTAPITPVVYLTNGSGAIDVQATDDPALDWLPTTAWPVGRIAVVKTVSLTVATNENGTIDIDLAVYQPGSYDVLADADHRYRPVVLDAPGHVPMEVVDRGTILKLAHVPAIW